MLFQVRALQHQKNHSERSDFDCNLGQDCKLQRPRQCFHRALRAQRNQRIHRHNVSPNSSLLCCPKIAQSTEFLQNLGRGYRYCGCIHGYRNQASFDKLCSSNFSIMRFPIPKEMMRRSCTPVRLRRAKAQFHSDLAEHRFRESRFLANRSPQLQLHTVSAIPQRRSSAVQASPWHLRALCSTQVFVQSCE